MLPDNIDFGGSYVTRSIDAELDELFDSLPAILLDGPKGVGKTATALQRCKSTRRLDRVPERTALLADVDQISTDDFPLLIDEWHLLPEVWDAVRRQVDQDFSGGRFLLTGSAPRKGTHSGAGRISTIRMRPLTIPERLKSQSTVSLKGLLNEPGQDVSGRSVVNLQGYVDDILAGGFPGMRHLKGRPLEQQLDSYLARIVDHDLHDAGLTVRRPETVMAWLRGYAAATSTTTSWEKIRDAATTGISNKPAKSTTMPYIELLTELRILDPLTAWIPSRNHLRALTNGPKHHLADPALAARLLKITSRQLLTGGDADSPVVRDGTFLGALFESLTALSIRVFAQSVGADVFHLRTEGGRHEIDLIVETGDGVIGIEVKLGGTVQDSDVKHLLWLKKQLGQDCLDLIVITTGPQAYRRADGVAVVPLALLGP